MEAKSISITILEFAKFQRRTERENIQKVPEPHENISTAVSQKFLSKYHKRKVRDTSTFKNYLGKFFFTPFDLYIQANIVIVKAYIFQPRKEVKTFCLEGERMDQWLLVSIPCGSPQVLMQSSGGWYHFKSEIHCYPCAMQGLSVTNFVVLCYGKLTGYIQGTDVMTVKQIWNWLDVFEDDQNPLLFLNFQPYHRFFSMFWLGLKEAYTKHCLASCPDGC